MERLADIWSKAKKESQLNNDSDFCLQLQITAYKSFLNADLSHHQ